MKSVAIEGETTNVAADFAELVKARLTLLVLATTAVVRLVISRFFTSSSEPPRPQPAQLRSISGGNESPMR